VTGTRDEATRLVQMSKKERADIFKTKSSGQEIVTLGALFDVFVNTFTEDSSLPGLDVFIGQAVLTKSLARLRSSLLQARKLSLDSRLIDNRPHLRNLSGAKFIEDVLGKGNHFAVYRETKKHAFRGTIKA
jgi:hypothetical protein